MACVVLVGLFERAISRKKDKTSQNTLGWGVLVTLAAAGALGRLANAANGVFSTSAVNQSTR